MEGIRQLTVFQQTCEQALCAALAAEGLSLTNRFLGGQLETYVQASVTGTDITVYIYGDEAQFHRGGKRAGVYERYDFPSSAELQQAFLSGVMEATHDT